MPVNSIVIVSTVVTEKQFGARAVSLQNIVGMLAVIYNWTLRWDWDTGVTNILMMNIIITTSTEALLSCA